MKWLTIPQIKRRSKTAKGALKVSYEHWCQLYDATAKELREAIIADKVGLGSGYCGLCVFYNVNCSICSLKKAGCHCFPNSSVYQKANREWKKWRDKCNGDWHTWKRACKAMREKLRELLEQGD